MHICKLKWQLAEYKKHTEHLDSLHQKKYYDCNKVQLWHNFEMLVLWYHLIIQFIWHGVYMVFKKNSIVFHHY